jgi:hypothetical protein
MKIFAALPAALVGFSLLASSGAEARPRHIAPVVAAGVIGGLAVGAAIAATTPHVVYYGPRRVRTVRVVPVRAPARVYYGCTLVYGC